MSSPRIPLPLLEKVLAFGPVLLLLLLGLGGWALPARWQGAALYGGWLWGSAILLFLAGVTRGLSFFTPGGPRAPQVIQSIWLFVLGLGALATPATIGFVLLTLGYASIGLFDSAAARRGLAPERFARLRPPQTAIAVAALLLLLLRVLGG